MIRRTRFPKPPEPRPALTLAPLAWLKLQYFCHAGPTEIGGFGVAAPNNPLYIEEFVTVRQHVTLASVRFVDAAVADYFDTCVDRGLKPESFGRVWLHTHPSASVLPSSTDEATLARCFGRCDWSVMFILGRTGRTYARLALQFPTVAVIPLRTVIDWSAWPATIAPSDDSLDKLHIAWQAEYTAHVQPEQHDQALGTSWPFGHSAVLDDFWNDMSWLELPDASGHSKEGGQHERSERLSAK